MPRPRMPAIKLNHAERAHSAAARARTLRQVALATGNGGAKALLETQAKAWDAEALEAARLAHGETADSVRNRRLTDGGTA